MNGKLKLLWVGRFTGIKDPLYAINTISRLKNGDVELVMVGGGELFDDIKNKSNGLPITFTGWMKDPFIKITDFDLLLITSKNEGLPLVMLEAANHSRPTLARNVGGMSEFIENNKTGILVNGDPDDMAKAIEKLILDRSVLETLGSNANNLLHDEYSLKKMAGEYLDFYKNLTVRN
jgi:glycosyltransferase involved in cell wall biosynthesis